MSRTILIVILTILVLIAVTLYWKKEEFRYQPVCGINPMGQFGANLRQMNERLESLGPMSAEERQNQIFSMLQQPQSVSANTFESVNQGQVPIGDISSLVQSFEQPINPFLQPMVQFPQQMVQFPQQMVQQFPQQPIVQFPQQMVQFQQPMPQMGFQGQGMRLPSSFEAAWNSQAVQQTPQVDFNRYWSQPVQQQQPDFNRYWNQGARPTFLPAPMFVPMNQWKQPPLAQVVQDVQQMLNQPQAPVSDVQLPEPVVREVEQVAQAVQSLAQNEDAVRELEQVMSEYNEEANQAINNFVRLSEREIAVNQRLRESKDLLRQEQAESRREMEAPQVSRMIDLSDVDRDLAQEMEVQSKRWDAINQDLRSSINELLEATKSFKLRTELERQQAAQREKELELVREYEREMEIAFAEMDRQFEKEAQQRRARQEQNQPEMSQRERDLVNSILGMRTGYDMFGLENTPLLDEYLATMRTELGSNPSLEDIKTYIGETYLSDVEPDNVSLEYFQRGNNIYQLLYERAEDEVIPLEEIRQRYFGSDSVYNQPITEPVQQRQAENQFEQDKQRTLNAIKAMISDSEVDSEFKLRMNDYLALDGLTMNDIQSLEQLAEVFGTVDQQYKGYNANNTPQTFFEVLLRNANAPDSVNNYFKDQRVRRQNNDRFDRPGRVIAMGMLRTEEGRNELYNTASAVIENSISVNMVENAKFIMDQLQRVGYQTAQQAAQQAAQQEREEREDLQMLLLTQSVQSLKDIVANLLMSATTDKEMKKAQYIMDRIRAAGHDVSSLERLLPNQQPAQQGRERVAQQEMERVAQQAVEDEAQLQQKRRNLINNIRNLTSMYNNAKSDVSRNHYGNLLKQRNAELAQLTTPEAARQQERERVAEAARQKSKRERIQRADNNLVRTLMNEDNLRYYLDENTANDILYRTRNEDFENMYLDELEELMYGLQDTSGQYESLFDKLFDQIIINSGQYESEEEKEIIDSYAEQIRESQNDLRERAEREIVERRERMQEAEADIVRDLMNENQLGFYLDEDTVEEIMEVLQNQEVEYTSLEYLEDFFSDMPDNTGEYANLFDRLFSEIILNSGVDRSEEETLIRDRYAVEIGERQSELRDAQEQEDLEEQEEAEEQEEQKQETSSFEQKVYYNLQRELGDREWLDSAYGDEKFKDVLEQLFEENNNFDSLIKAASKIQIEGFESNYADFILNDYLRDEYKFANKNEKANYEELVDKYEWYTKKL